MISPFLKFSQFSCSVWLFAIPWIAACLASLSITNSQSLLKLMSIESVIPSNHLILCCPLLLPPSVFPSISVFSKGQFFTSGGQSIGVSASTLVLPMNTQDWLDLLAVQGTPRSLLQHHSSKAAILWHSVFLMVHLSHPYRFTGKTVAMTMQTFVGKVMSLLFNTLSSIVIAFHPFPNGSSQILTKHCKVVCGCYSHFTHEITEA